MGAPMLYSLLEILPRTLNPAGLYLAVGLATIGVGLWLLGARWSRPMITLGLVAVGTVLGRNLPGWMGWSIDPMGPAIGGALVLGLSGFILHRVWVGIGLGAVLALWAFVGCWVILSGDPQVQWNKIDTAQPLPVVIKATWEQLPAEVTHVLPYACGTAAVVGATLVFLWPMVSTALLYSVLGVAMLVGGGLTAMQVARPGWLELLPARTWAQLTLLAFMVLVGTLLQRRALKPKGAKKQRHEDPQADSMDAMIGYKPRRA